MSIVRQQQTPDTMVLQLLPWPYQFLQRVIESFDEQERSELSVPMTRLFVYRFYQRIQGEKCTKLYWEI